MPMPPSYPLPTWCRALVEVTMLVNFLYKASWEVLRFLLSALISWLENMQTIPEEVTYRL